MNMEERIARINELYHKSVNEGLNEEEKKEQAKLRREYIDSVKGSLISQLDNVDIKEKDGSITNLGKLKQEKDKKKSDANSCLNSNKARLRKEFLAKRNSLSKEDIINKSSLITEKLLNEKAYKEAKIVLLYASYGSEVMTLEIFNKAILDGKRVAFPKCTSINNEPSLDFYEINNIEQLKEGYKGILEPDTDDNNVKKLDEIADICIVPGVAFTRKGNRIGYGKGYYDRFIQAGNIKKTIGITYKQQLTHKIDTEKTDKAVDMVITEENVYVCN